MAAPNTGPFNVLLLGTKTDGTVTGVSADETTSQAMQLFGLNAVIYLQSLGTTSSGVVTLEEAHWFDDEMPYGNTATWSTITTINASSFTGGAQLAYHLPSPVAYRYFRVRISTAIGGGGTIACRLYAA